MTDGRVHLRLLTNSRMNCFRDCTERHYIRYELGYEPVITPRPLLFGTGFHSGAEGYWNARKIAHKNPLSVGLEMLPKEGDLDAFDIVRLRVLLMAYAVVWDRIPCRVLGVEVPFEMPLVNPHTGDVSPYWRKAGKIDLILEVKGPRIVLVEHKTTSDDPTPGSTYSSRVHVDEQISYYMQAATQLGYRPDTIVYDVIKKPDIRPLKAVANVKLKKDGEPRKGQRMADETPDEFGKRFLEEIQADVKKYIVQIPVKRLSNEMERFDKEVWGQSEIMRFSNEAQYHPRNSHACGRHYGSNCPYLDVCRGTARLQDTSKFVKLDNLHPELHAGTKRT